MKKALTGAQESAVAEIDAIAAPPGDEAAESISRGRAPSRAMLDLIGDELKRIRRESVTAKTYDLIDDYRKTPEGRASYNSARRDGYAAEVRDGEQRQVRAYRPAPADLDRKEAKRRQKAESKARLKEALTPEQIEAKREAAKLYMRQRRAAKANP